VATIWRILTRRGPRSFWKRFEAGLPNQCWQADVSHWRLADHTEVEILDLIDDHSRVGIAGHARPVTTDPDVVDPFVTAFAQWGTPAGVLTDNGAIFTAKQRVTGSASRVLSESSLTDVGACVHGPGQS
jgi:hypothetical protein